MKIDLDRVLCESNALCVLAAPTVFALGDDDQLVVLVPEPGAELRDSAEQAIHHCPKQALSSSE